jgi:KDO2-lipid IV(A) lauroyltransferase
MKNTLRQVVQFKKSNTRFVLGLISDQSPGKNEIQYWTTFLTQPTPIITGPEKMAHIIKGPVVYIKLRKLRRGYYHVDVIPYPGDINTSKEHDLTEWHVRLLEESIRERPELWLWSHKRWKYQSSFYEKKQ